MNKKLESEILSKFDQITQRLAEETPHRDYCLLQKTWNADVIKYSANYIESQKNQGSAICLGSFLGAFEMAVSDYFNQVIAVDHENFLPDWRPDNVIFHQANLDGCSWQLPEQHFSICYMIEILEHMLWSPIPLLHWIANHCGVLVISTPDDDEWPAMPDKPYARRGHFNTIPAAFPGCPPNPEPMFHCKQYKQHEFVELLNFCGFRIMEFHRLTEHKHQMLIIATPRPKKS